MWRCEFFFVHCEIRFSFVADRLCLDRCQVKIGDHGVAHLLKWLDLYSQNRTRECLELQFTIHSSVSRFSLMKHMSGICVQPTSGRSSSPRWLLLFKFFEPSKMSFFVLRVNDCLSIFNPWAFFSFVLLTFANDTPEWTETPLRCWTLASITIAKICTHEKLIFHNCCSIFIFLNKK